MRAGRIVACAAISWCVAAACFALHGERSVCTMLLLVVVMAAATRGDWVLAVLTSISASLALSWYFIDVVGSLRITSVEGGVALATMLISALIVSQLAVRARRRTDEAVRRRNEMERLHQFGSILHAAQTTEEAARDIARGVVDLLDQTAASLRLGASGPVFEQGAPHGEPSSIPIGAGSGVLRIWGHTLSSEVRHAIANLVGLVLDRARTAEERSRVEAAQRGEELRNTVLNALAHNFKTPLTSIKAAASLLRVSPDMPEGSRTELVAVIDEEADRLGQLIEESLDVARIEAHRANPRIEACGVAAMISAVAGRISRHLSGREMTTDIPEDLPCVLGDRFLYEQMVLQVVDNAWKYSKPGSPIRIAAERGENGATVILRVWNEGSGIPSEEREKIFDRFYRGAALRSRVEGSGLGLAISKAIAEAHGGAMWLDSDETGPVFCFSLPAERTGDSVVRQTDYVVG